MAFNKNTSHFDYYFEENFGLAHSILETVREPLIVLDSNLRIYWINNSFLRTFKVSREETENELIYDIGEHQWNIPQLRELLNETLIKNKEFNDFKVIHNFPRIGRKVMLLNARKVKQKIQKKELILLAIEDITEQTKLRKDLLAAYHKEKSISQTLQKSLLPESVPKIKGLDIKYYYQPSSKALVGGDFIDVFNIPENGFGIVMGDVSGHGIEAAAETAKVKYLVRDKALFGLSPDKVLSEINNSLFRQKTDLFTALTYALYNPKNAVLKISNAGNPYTYFLTNDLFIDITGTPVSLIKNKQYPLVGFELKKGDTFIMYTDGLIEARYNGKFFGEEGIRKFIKKNKKQPLTNIIKGLAQEALDFSHNNLFDDVLIIGIEKI